MANQLQYDPTEIRAVNDHDAILVAQLVEMRLTRKATESLRDVLDRIATALESIQDNYTADKPLTTLEQKTIQDFPKYDDNAVHDVKLTENPKDTPKSK